MIIIIINYSLQNVNKYFYFNIYITLIVKFYKVKKTNFLTYY